MLVKWESFLPIEGYVIVVEDDVTLRFLMEEVVMEVGIAAIPSRLRMTH